MEQQSESRGPKKMEEQKSVPVEMPGETAETARMWDEYIAWCIKQENSTHE